MAVRPLLPAGWQWERDSGTASMEIPPRTDGWAGLGATHPDAVLTLIVRVPSDTSPGLYVIPLSMDYRDRKLGAYRHALVRVR